jgi:hypothetical protein
MFEPGTNIYFPLYATKTVPTVNRKHFFINILCVKFFFPHRNTKECCFSLVHSSNTVAILTTDTSFWTGACAFAIWTGLCCYIVIHIENLLRQLQLFYFYLWPVYWLSLGIPCNFQHDQQLHFSEIFVNKFRNSVIVVSNSIVELNWQSFEMVDTFKYLASIVTSQNETENDIKNKTAAANRCFHALNKSFSNK